MQKNSKQLVHFFKKIAFTQHKISQIQPAHSRQNRVRLSYVTIGVFFIFSLLVWRLIDVQLVRGKSFWDSAERNRWFELAVVPDRGVFLDRFGLPIVENQRSYLELENAEQLYSTGKIISSEQALALLATDSAKIRKISNREYPYAQALAHVLGYVGLVSREDIDRDKKLQTFGVSGKNGLELAYEQQVRGQLGKDRFEVDASVQRQRKFSIAPAVSGNTIETTLDPILSEIAYRALGEQNGVVAISDVTTGQILSLVSKPSYDPNIFSDLDPLLEPKVRSAAVAQVQTWFTDTTQPFFNRAVSGQYPPGSIFKLVTALAGLEAKVVTPSTTILDVGVLEVGEFTYANWYWTQYGKTDGEVNMVKALARSNDIYFYKVAELIGPNRLAQLSRLFGLGSPVGIGIGGETSGLVPDPAWKLAVVGEPWYLGNTYHYGIGQGDIKTTPLQLLQLIQAIGNNGTMCAPTLVEADRVSCQELGISQESINTVLLGMLDACSPGGTAFPFFTRNGVAFEGLDPTNTSSIEPAISKGAVACKTGTAEFGGEDFRGYRNTHALWGGIVEPKIEEKATGKSVSESQENEDILQIDQDQTDTQNEAAVQTLTENSGVFQKPITTLTDDELYQLWIARVAQLRKSGTTYPKRLALLVIAESDEKNPFKEGSREAGPVGAAILDWMEGK